jgi:FkbM family methyltransferase
VADARRRFFRLARDYTPYVTVELKGRLLLVATHDDTHEAIFLEVPKEHRLLMRALEGLQAAGIDVVGKTFLDIGANNGTASFAALSTGFSSVVACEPGPDAFRLLRANLALNDVEDVVVALNVALSNRSGSGSMDLTRGSRKGFLVDARETASHRHAEAVNLVRLDDLVEQGIVDPAGVGLLWMDVEGHESQVLEGATRLLSAEPPPPLVMELHPKRVRQAGAMETLTGLLTRHYTHFLELRAKFDRPDFTPIDTIDTLIAEVEARWAATDLLVCRIS